MDCELRLRRIRWLKPFIWCVSMKTPEPMEALPESLG